MKKQFEEISFVGQAQEERPLTVFKEQIDFNEHLEEIKSGYGACFVKYCTCTGWKPNNPKNDYCKNCGHHWSQHY